MRHRGPVLCPAATNGRDDPLAMSQIVMAHPFARTKYRSSNENREFAPALTVAKCRTRWARLFIPDCDRVVLSQHTRRYRHGATCPSHQLRHRNAPSYRSPDHRPHPKVLLFGQRRRSQQTTIRGDGSAQIRPTCPSNFGRTEKFAGSRTKITPSCAAEITSLPSRVNSTVPTPTLCAFPVLSIGVPVAASKAFIPPC